MFEVALPSKSFEMQFGAELICLIDPMPRSVCSGLGCLFFPGFFDLKV